MSSSINRIVRCNSDGFCVLLALTKNQSDDCQEAEHERRKELRFALDVAEPEDAQVAAAVFIDAEEVVAVLLVVSVCSDSGTGSIARSLAS